MTKNEMQNLSNEICLDVFNDAMREYYENYRSRGQLRSCKAVVLETDSYYILRSYNTIVAIIDKAIDTGYDCLRQVYGYTSTSAQHINKFFKDYGRGKWGVEMIITAR